MGLGRGSGVGVAGSSALWGSRDWLSRCPVAIRLFLSFHLSVHRPVSSSLSSSLFVCPSIGPLSVLGLPLHQLAPAQAPFSLVL